MTPALPTLPTGTSRARRCARLCGRWRRARVPPMDSVDKTYPSITERKHDRRVTRFRPVHRQTQKADN